MKLGTQIPVYVTRETANGYIGALFFNAYACLSVLFLVIANALLWGAVGIIAALNSLGLT
jgi:hypothetical protein